MSLRFLRTPYSFSLPFIRSESLKVDLVKPLLMWYSAICMSFTWILAENRSREAWRKWIAPSGKTSTSSTSLPGSSFCWFALFICSEM